VPAADNLPFTNFPTDYTQLPKVSFVIPNFNDDMHDGTVAAADTWLQTNLNAYVQWAATHNSLLIVTWDHDDGTAANRIPTLFVGPMVKAGNYAETITHYNVLRTVEDMYGLPYLGQDATAAPITDVWKTLGPTGSAVNAAAAADFGGGLAVPTVTMASNVVTDPVATAAPLVTSDPTAQTSTVVLPTPVQASPDQQTSASAAAPDQTTSAPTTSVLDMLFSDPNFQLGLDPLTPLVGY
jgi:hypothetical protein